MKVKVIPSRPIPGILPKNKFICTETVMDLNEREIIYCTKYGSVYDEDGNLIDERYFPLLKFKTLIPQVKCVDDKPIKDIVLGTVGLKEKAIPEVVIEPEIKNELVKDYKLSLVTSEDGEYVIVEATFETSVGKIGGNMYGLFTILSGSRPSVEYKVGEDEWVKFNNKFASYSVLENGDKFLFRFIPKSNFKYRISIKEGNNILVSEDNEYTK